MSTNSTSTETDGVVLSGGIIFVIVFCGTSLFFIAIMSVVCCGEYKKYRTRKPRTPWHGGGYPKQLEPLGYPAVTNPGLPSANYPRQQFETIDNIDKDGMQNTAHTITHTEQSEKTHSAVETNIPIPAGKKIMLPPLDFEKTREVTNPETIFSPRTEIVDNTTVAFVEPALPAINSGDKDVILPPVDSSNL